MTRQAEAAFKAWWRTQATGKFMPTDTWIKRAYLAAHAAADTDATRKLARMVELAGMLEAEAAENDGKRGEPYRYMAEVARRAASRIRAIVEDNQSNSAVTPAAAEYSTPQAPAHSEIEPDGRPEEER